MFKETSVSTNYECRQEGIIVQGSFTKDEQGNVTNVNGYCYRPNEDGSIGANFGNFNGRPINGELRYDFSEMSRRDNNKAWDAIDEIESNILPADGE